MPALNQQSRITGPKIAKISTQTKLKWVKFDKNFQGFLNDTKKINQLIEDSFDATGLSDDYKELNEHQNIEQVIKGHLQNAKDKRLSQKNVQSIVKDLYMYEDEDNVDNHAP